MSKFLFRVIIVCFFLRQANIKASDQSLFLFFITCAIREKLSTRLDIFYRRVVNKWVFFVFQKISFSGSDLAIVLYIWCLICQALITQLYVNMVSGY